MTVESVVVAELSALKSGAAQRFVVADRAVSVIRIGDHVYALGDTCSHADISLSEGEVLADSLEIECWKHGSAFSIVTGEPSTLPATQPVPVYTATVIDGKVVIQIETEDAI
jgi:3-phenylpropionate/trans-cinnamate dioxygenase ferredoxin component